MASGARSDVARGEVARMRWWTGAAIAVGAARSWSQAEGRRRPVPAAAGKATVFTGYAFDACNAPSNDALTAWLQSPYRALGIYIGGVNRACSNIRLSADWAATAVATGWSLLPLYVGLQAPCVGGHGLAKISSTIASSQGTAAADDAAGDAQQLGLGAGSPIYFDLEGYDKNNPPCTAVVQAFVSAWVDELHALGYLAGVYGSAASTIRDLQALAATTSSPDDVWIGDWNNQESVFGSPYVSDTLWTNHQRIHQFRGGHHETWGNVTIDIDTNYVDAAVVGSVERPAADTAAAAGAEPGAVRRRLRDRHGRHRDGDAGRSARSRSRWSSRWRRRSRPRRSRASATAATACSCR